MDRSLFSLEWHGSVGSQLHPLIYMVVWSRQQSQASCSKCLVRKWDRGHKLKQIMLGLDIKKSFFLLTTVPQRSWIPRNVEQSPSLDVSKIQLDQAPRNVTWPQSYPCFEHAAVPSMVPFNLNYPSIQEAHLSLETQNWIFVFLFQLCKWKSKGLSDVGSWKDQ